MVLDSGYKEDYYVRNVMIILGFLTCCFAVAAQFYPKKFPDNMSVLLLCIAGYILFNLILQLFINYKEMDNILFTYAKEASKNAPTGILMSSHFDGNQVRMCTIAGPSGRDALQ